MKFIFIWLLIGIAFFACKREKPGNNRPQPPGDEGLLKDYNKDITIANWNIEWFGDPSGFHGNLNDQELNAGKVLNYLAADLYGLCEIVDTARFGRMIRNNLGSDFRYVISFFTNGAQKMAFVYNRHIFRNISVRPFMAVSGPAYYNFGNRYPYLLQAEVAVNGARKEISFVLIHAKADNDPASYNRRLGGSLELKDSLDTYYAGKNVIILGDYNDNFDKSIVRGKPSPYQNFLNDTVRYNPITRPLNVPGNQSSLGYVNSVIDQQIISSSMNNWYLSASARIRTDVVHAVPAYTSGNTSDHYPITSMYRIRP